MYMHVYACTYVCVHAFIYVHICIRRYVCMYVKQVASVVIRDQPIICLFFHLLCYAAKLKNLTYLRIMLKIIPTSFHCNADLFMHLLQLM